MSVFLNDDASNSAQILDNLNFDSPILGTNELTDDGFLSIFPNPASATIQLSFGER